MDTERCRGHFGRARPARLRPVKAPIQLASAAVLLLCPACAVNPWPEAYTALEAAPPVERADLLLVDFDEAHRDRVEAGMERLGYASFTGEYSRDVERSLRSFAMERGASFVAWGAKYLHTQARTDLQPVFETYTSRRHGDHYDPREGRYRDDDRSLTTSVTRYVPVVDVDAIYAFRAVFYRDARAPANVAPDTR